MLPRGLFWTLAFALILFTGHSPYLSLPFFWDELGQYVPAALDLYRDGALVPHSAIPNVHPPGVMAWLAATWNVVGYSIAATRSAMLVLASFGVLCAALLAKQLRVPVFLAIVPLLADPLFFTQSMMAQLDMPAMVFGLVALVLYFETRHLAAAVACCALVMCKETGIVLPLVLGVALLLQKGDRARAAWYAVPFLVLAGWLTLLWRTTGSPFGDPAFAHYNTTYALHPVRMAVAFMRRAYYLFFADFRWVATASILYGLRRGVYRQVGWRIVAAFAVLQTIEVTVLGGAQLERYLIPVLPLLYIAAAASWARFSPVLRGTSVAVLCAGLLAGLALNPSFPFPYENNLAMADFVELHRSAARYLEQNYPGHTVHTAWPLTAELRTPEFGYVQHAMHTVETSDLHYSTLHRLNPAQVRVLVMYSRDWDAGGRVTEVPWVRQFLTRYFEYERQMTTDECVSRFGLTSVVRFERRGQWVEIYGPKIMARYHKEAEGSSHE